MSTDAESVELVDVETTLNLARAAVMAALISVFAAVGSIPIPLSPVPVSLQPLAVFLAGLLLGARWGAASMLLYLAAGAVGAPVFAGGAGGIGVLFGYTAGYLWGYPLAAAVVGLVVYGGTEASGRVADVPLARVGAALALATVVIYALGVAGLMAVAGTSLEKAVVEGALVFLPGEVVKMVAAAGIVQSEELNRVLASG